MSATNPTTCTIPFDRDGAHHGHLCLPYSREESAWGVVRIPITVLKNGDGPTALLTGANHGDEYEGPIAIQNLAQDLDPADLTGRVILVPYTNYPAFRGGRRNSPLDGRNLNRTFPGRPDGTATEKIADYFLQSLVPLADAVLDFHSGGKSLDFIPFAAAHLLDNPVQEAACIAAMRAFNAPYSMILRELDAVGMFDTACEAAGKVFVSTELGGGGSATARSVRIAKRGALNFLRHVGVLKGSCEMEPSVQIDTTRGEYFHFAPCDGLLEMLFDLGEMVETGQPIAKIWPLDRSGQAPSMVCANHAGILAARHFPGLTASGDCLAVIASLAVDR